MQDAGERLRDGDAEGYGGGYGWRDVGEVGSLASDATNVAYILQGTG